MIQCALHKSISDQFNLYLVGNQGAEIWTVGQKKSVSEVYDSCNNNKVGWTIATERRILSAGK